MSTYERNVAAETAIELAKNGVRLFSNPVGVAVFRGADGTIERSVAYGLIVGSGDQIGIAPIVVTENMVGLTLGVFVSIEIKSLKGSAGKRQRWWRDLILSLGGVAIVARTSQEAISAVRGWVHGR